MHFGNYIKGYEVNLNKVEPIYDKEGKMINQKAYDKFKDFEKK